MAEQLTSNSHYLSRFVTAPWEYEQRFLRYYDFGDNQFHSCSSKSLFAADDINSQGVEDWLDRMIETPFGRIRDRVARGERDPLEQDWSCYRAAMLLIILQGGRIAAIADLDARQRLDALAMMPERDLDWMVRLALRKFDLRLLHTESMPLCVPETGLFCMIMPDIRRFLQEPFGFGIPINPTCALLATPAESGEKLDLTKSRTILATSSVATSTARRVVVPPELYRQLGKDRLREKLLWFRQQNEQLLAVGQEKRRIVARMFADATIKVR